MLENGNGHKVSDIFAKTRPFAGDKAAAFEKAFPSIDDLSVEVRPSQDHRQRRMRTGANVSAYDRRNMTEYIDCASPRCGDGGFHLGTILRDMIAQQDQSLEITLPCQGYRRSRIRRQKPRLCDNAFTVKVTIRYKPVPRGARIPYLNGHHHAESRRLDSVG